MPPGLRLPATIVVGLVALLWLAGGHAESQLTPMRVGVDDASIYFRYARNVADGLGCVWNPGGERVEGCSSLLWTAVCAVIFTFTRDPEPWAFAAGVVFGAVAGAIVAGGLARLLDDRRGFAPTLTSAVFVAAWIGSSPGFVTWMTAALMDTPLWTVAIVLAWSAACRWMADPGSRRRQVALGIASSLVAIARPEGPLLSATIVAAAAFLVRRDHTPVQGLRNAVVPAAMVTATASSLFAARRIYFGWLLPNTYYAKLDQDVGYRIDLGFQYLWSFVRAFPIVSAAWVLATGFVLVRLRARPATSAATIVTFGILNAIVSGGDHFGCWRILQPYWLLALVPIVTAVTQSQSLRGRILAGALAVAAAAFSVVRAEPSWNHLQAADIRGSFMISEAGRHAAAGFNEIFPEAERPLVGVVGAGSFPYAYGGRSFDLLGLNDVEMAHASGTRRGVMHGHGGFHAATFFRRPPDILIGHLQMGFLATPEPPGVRIPFASLDASEEARFDALYAPVMIWTEASRRFGAMLPAWARRDWLDAAKGRYSLLETSR